MKKVLFTSFAVILLSCLCACTNPGKLPSDVSTTPATTMGTETSIVTTTQSQAVELTIDNVEEYLSFEVSKEMSDINPDGADHILKVSPLVDGDFSGVNIVVEIPLYDHWYNSYTTEIDLTATVNLTKVGKATVTHPIFFDVAGLYETRGIKGDDDPIYIIKSVSGTVK